jgi:methionyl-tRNA formyltransferase
VRAVFFGTPEVAAVGLDALLASRHTVAAVVTQPDRPRGRSRAPQPSPVKARALAANIPVHQPDSPKEEGFADQLRSFGADVLAVVAYGHILPRGVLAVAPAVNAHFSLLPKYRGAAPVQRAIEAGESETGVTTFLLEPTVDSGPVLFQERVAIGEEETAGELLARLAPVGARLLVQSIDVLEAGNVGGLAQDAAAATPAPKVRPEEAEIDWARPAPDIARKVRAFNPSPGARTAWSGGRLKIWRARPIPGRAGPPGTVLSGTDPMVACGDGLLALLEVQPEGGRRMTGAEYLRGHGAIASEKLGPASRDSGHDPG